MKALVFIFVLLFSITGISLSQSNKNNLPVDSVCFMGIHFEDSFTGWAVSGCGGILKTTDCGNRWSVQKEVKAGKCLLSVYFFDTNTGWVTGRNGVILKTQNGGINWNYQHSGTKKDIYGVQFVNNNVGYAVGDNGLVMKTTDGGEVWKHYKGKLKEFFVSLFFIDENTGWITGGKYENDSYSGGIYKTENGGDDWNKVYENEGGFVNSIYMKSKDEGMAVCDEGKVLVLQNGAVKDIQQIPSARDLFCVYFANPNKAYVVGCKGVIYFSEDNGINWVTIDSGTDKNLYTVFAPVKNVCFISGEKGIFIKK